MKGAVPGRSCQSNGIHTLDSVEKPSILLNGSSTNMQDLRHRSDLHLSVVHMKLSAVPQRTGEISSPLTLAGERTGSDGKAVANHILRSLPEREFEVLRPLLSFVRTPHHVSLHEPGWKIEFAYFPNAGLVSLVVAMKEGKTVEVGVVGNEGLIGTPAVQI